MGMLRITSERTLDVEKELCLCFSDCRKVLDRLDWTKLMRILKRTGTNRYDRRLTSKLCMDQSVKIKTAPGGDNTCEEWTRS